MEENSQINEICKALALAQLSFGTVKKTKTMAIPGRKPYKYADLADVMEAIRSHLSKNELVLTHDVLGSDTLVTTVFHSSGQRLSTRLKISHPANEHPQSYGAVLTYARRYSVCNLLGIVAEDDTDGVAEELNNNKEIVVDTAPPTGNTAGYDKRHAAAMNKTINEKQIGLLMAIANENNWKDEDIKSYIAKMGMKSRRELNTIQLNALLENIRKFPNQVEEAG